MCREYGGGEDVCETYHHNGEVVSIASDGEISLAPKISQGKTVVVKEFYTQEQTMKLINGNTLDSLQSWLIDHGPVAGLPATGHAD
tara:strand:- start:1415 stop:1672 length:258 start_codon:yes stop_codon:yes gene_type:complete